MTTRRNLLSRGSLSVGSASRAEMCEQPILSVGSSKMASGVAAELERDRVAVLGDTAMRQFGGGVTRAVDATVSKSSHG